MVRSMQTKVMTVIANPAIKTLEMSTINALKTILVDIGITPLEGFWLAHEEAYDLMIQGDNNSVLEKMIAHLKGRPYDLVIQPIENRRKKMLIADMDSTMITIECIDELADFAGIKDKVAEITERAMNGELDFIAALQERVALLTGLEETVLQRAYDERVEFTQGGKALLATMRKNGGKAVLVSGGFTFFTSRVAKTLGFDDQRANILDIKDGKLTGKVIEPVLDKKSKLESLYYYAEKFGLTSDNIIAVGDGANDLPMLRAAGTGVAYHAKPNVQQAVNTRINHADLTALLYIQGYRKEEIITA